MQNNTEILFDFFPGCNNIQHNSYVIRLIAKHGYHVTAVVYLHFSKLTRKWTTSIKKLENLSQGTVSDLRKLLGISETIIKMKIETVLVGNNGWNDELIEKIKSTRK